MTALNLGIHESGNPEIWDPKNPQVKILKIKIRVAQNVGKIWISRKKILLASFGAISGPFLHRPKRIPKIEKFCLFPLVGQWACSPGLESSSYIWLGW